MTWALKRQLMYISIVILFFLGFGFLITYPYFHKAPTCSDYKMNGDETGVDCGGSCIRACMIDQDKLAVLWSRAFKVVPGRYNAVAYIENKNELSAVRRINYRFRFADKDNIYIGKREGYTFIPPGGRFAIFEPAIDIGNSVPVYTTFEFTQSPTWIQVDKAKVDQLKVFATNIRLSDENSAPRMSATLKNNSLFIIPNISAVAILYDENHNAVSVSKTYVEELKGQEEKPIFFTWAEPFTKKIVSKEIIPVYNIDTVKLK